MKTASKSLVFFGSGPVAAQSLELLAENFEIEAIITKPKPPHHKGDVPVLKVAQRLKLKVFEASNKAELDGLIDRDNFESQLGVLIDFGIIVSQKVIDSFPQGIINSHFSILPEWRGADPITFAILSGQEINGVSLMLLVAAMDEGPLLAYGEFEMPKDITEPVLTEELIKLSDALLLYTIPRYQAGEVEAVPQTITGRAVSYSRKLSKADGLIDWNKPAEQIEREVRAFINWPKSHTTLGGMDLIITKAHVVPSSAPNTKPGDYQVIKDAGVVMVTTGAGQICIEKLKPAGKPEMSIQAFLAGYGQKL